MKLKSIGFLFAFMLAFSLQALQDEQNVISFQAIPIYYDDPNSNIDNLAREAYLKMDSRERLSYQNLQFQHGPITCITNKFHYIFCSGTINNMSAVDETLYEVQQSSTNRFRDSSSFKNIIISTFRAGDNRFCYQLFVSINGRIIDYFRDHLVISHLISCVSITQ